jgi:predicted oxidoreductase
MDTEIVIAGGGLAGIVTAYELLSSGHRVLLIDKDKRENFGGLAKQSFGGVHMIDTPAPAPPPHQRFSRAGVA